VEIYISHIVDLIGRQSINDMPEGEGDLGQISDTGDNFTKVKPGFIVPGVMIVQKTFQFVGLLDEVGVKT